MRVHSTSYGRAAVELLRDRIAAAKADDPLRPVTVVVPTNYVGVSARRLLAGGELGPLTTRGPGVAGLTLLTIYRLAELLGAPRLAATGRRPVSTPVVAAAIRRVLADEPGIFAPVASHPTTEEALVRSYRELSELEPATLDALAAQGERAREVVRVRRAAHDRLAADWFEEADLMAAAEEAVAAGSPVLADLGAVLVHLPQDLSGPAASLLRRIDAAEHTAVEVLAARTGAERADADVHTTLHRLGSTPPADAPAPTPPATAVVSVSDAEEEARSAVARIIAAARDGVPLERMAILYPAAEPYAALVAEQLAAAGVPCNGRAVRPLADRLLGRWLLDLLALPGQRYARPAVLALLGGAPVVSDGQWVPATAWERASREAGIVRDRSAWRTKLPRLAEELRHRAEQEAASDDARDWLVTRLREAAQDTERFHAFVGELFDRLDTARRLTSWAELADWCRQTLADYLDGEEARQGWPEVERVAAERVEEALERLAGLDAVEPETSLAVFRRTLELELDDDLGRVGEFGHGVLVGLTSAGLGIDLDVVVVLGLAEGVLPTRPREDSLLPDAERQAAGDELRLRTAHLGVEHRHLLAALAASRGERVLVYPRGDLRRSSERVPSRWLLDAVEELRGDGVRELPASAGWLETVASFAQRVRTVAVPATRQEYGLRALADAPDPRRLPAHPLVAADAALRRGVELARTRGRGGFTRFDGNIGALAEHVANPADPDRVVSTSQLETWLACPHAYLMQHVLRIRPVENPEELLEIDPREKGSLIHDILEQWLRRRIAAGLPAPGEPWSADARADLHGLAVAACERAEARGVTGHPLLWRRDRRQLVDDLDRFVDHDDARRAKEALTPRAAEEPFGLPGTGSEPLTIDLGDGRSVRVRGRIDRLDTTTAGTLYVTDYKTGGTRGYRDLGAEAPLGDGTKLQLAVYGLAARVDPEQRVRSEYWFVTGRGGFARVGYELTDAVVAELGAALRVAADGIAAGHFPLRPPEPGWKPFTECAFCDPDDLGTTDRYRDWERIRTAGELAGYVAHVEPGADEPAAAT